MKDSYETLIGKMFRRDISKNKLTKEVYDGYVFYVEDIIAEEESVVKAKTFILGKQYNDYYINAYDLYCGIDWIEVK